MGGRVLLEDHCLSNRGGGIRTYTEALLRHWPTDASLQLVPFRNNHPVDKTSSDHLPIDTPSITLRPLSQLLAGRAVPSDRSHRKALLYHAYRAAFSVKARLGSFDAVFQPNNLCPNAAAPMIATLHDLSVVEHPEWHTVGRVERWRRCLPDAVRRTRLWITPSHFTRDRMTAILRIDPGIIHVIPEAARPLPTPASDSPLAKRRYLLFVGTLEPRKNIPLLLDAYAQLPSELRREHPLLLVGPTGWGPPDFWRNLIHHPVAAQTLVSGYLPDAHLAAAFANAAALFLPSFYEGFGLQLLEAMATGCPVVCSDIPVFREVSAGAAELRAPTDTPAWSALMRQALEDPAWRAARTAAGVARAQQFSWQTAAREHADLFAQVVGK